MRSNPPHTHHIGFIPSLLKLIKQSWAKPSSVPQISRRVENLYKTHGDNTAFLSRYPPPNSVIVDATQNRAKNQSNTTPNNKEGRKLNIIGHRVYSLGSFILCTANYLATMGAYISFLWNRALPSLQLAQGEYNSRCLTFHQEAMAVTHQEHITART